MTAQAGASTPGLVSWLSDRQLGAGNGGGGGQPISSDQSTDHGPGCNYDVLGAVPWQRRPHEGVRCRPFARHVILFCWEPDRRTCKKQAHATRRDATHVRIDVTCWSASNGRCSSALDSAVVPGAGYYCLQGTLMTQASCTKDNVQGVIHCKGACLLHYRLFGDATGFMKGIAKSRFRANVNDICGQLAALSRVTKVSMPSGTKQTHDEVFNAVGACLC